MQDQEPVRTGLLPYCNMYSACAVFITSITRTRNQRRSGDVDHACMMRCMSPDPTLNFREGSRSTIAYHRRPIIRVRQRFPNCSACHVGHSKISLIGERHHLFHRKVDGMKEEDEDSTKVSEKGLRSPYNDASEYVFFIVCSLFMLVHVQHPAMMLK